MTPEWTAEVVARWVRLYTKRLPPEIAQRRIDEIDGDLHDQIAHERADGVGDRRIARGIASRMIRGVAADTTWRRQQAKAVRPSATVQKPPKLSRSALRVALGVLLILLVPLIGTLASDGAGWGLGDFALAAVLLTTIGVAIELALRRAGNPATAMGIAVVGVAAGLLGQADDAPGLVLLGIVLTISAGGLGVRSAQHGK